jgi:prephenate dehydrogenase
MRQPFERIGIVGLGLIGGSIALAVRDRLPHVQVVGVDNPDVLDVARRIGAIDAGFETLDGLAAADAVVLAAPVRQNLALVNDLASHLTRPVIVTDAGSTKRDIVAAAERLPSHVTFVGGHPLSGAAVGGLEHARPDLFQGRRWVFTPTGHTPPEVLDRLSGFVDALGSTATIMSAEEHDRVLAFISHLPQLTASALMSVVGEAVGGDGLALAGRGLADSTRLASSPADIWRDIASSNADYIGPALDALVQTLQSMRADLASGDRLTQVFGGASRWRDELSNGSTL